MVVAYIEIERDEKWNGKGNINLIPKDVGYCAMLHGHEDGKLVRTIFKTDAPQAIIDAVKASHPDVRIYTSKKEMQLRGLQIQPGTPTLTEITELVDMLKTKYDINLRKEINPKTGKTWEKYLQEDVKHIGKGKIRCICGIINDPLHCTNCNAELSQGEQHKRIFNIDE